MLTVVGKNGCGNCVTLKEKLTKDGVEFEYMMLEDLDRETKRDYVNKARSAGLAHFPMVFENNEVIDITGGDK